MPQQGFVNGKVPRKLRKLGKTNGGSGGARTQRAKFVQQPILLIVRNIKWKVKIAENAHICRFEATVGRKLVGRSTRQAMVRDACRFCASEIFCILPAETQPVPIVGRESKDAPSELAQPLFTTAQRVVLAAVPATRIALRCLASWNGPITGKAP